MHKMLMMVTLVLNFKSLTSQRTSSCRMKLKKQLYLSNIKEKVFKQYQTVKYSLTDAKIIGNNTKITMSTSGKKPKDNNYIIINKKLV